MSAISDNSPVANASDALAALERFVVDNDALLELEERIGRCNIFDALGIVRTEIRHSNFLAWLLDPNESHGQSSLFLRAVLMDLLRQSPSELRPFSPIKLDGAELRGVRVQREHRNIDILIECDEPRFVIAIENKIDSQEHSEQLSRYRNTVREMFGEVPAQFVYLTREGDEPSDDEWTTYTYRDIHSTLLRVRNANASSIGDDVLTFLDHYLSLIGSRFMNDPQIDELCQTIYKNHRRAIELIMERAGAGSGIMGTIAAILREEHEDVIVLKATASQVHCVPKSWEAILPPIGSESGIDPRCWIRLYFEYSKANEHVFFVPYACPTLDVESRKWFIGRLTADSRFGFKIGNKSITDQWTRLCPKSFLLRWNNEDIPDETAIRKSLLATVQPVVTRLVNASSSLADLVQEWQRTRGSRK